MIHQIKAIVAQTYFLVKQKEGFGGTKPSLGILPASLGGRTPKRGNGKLMGVSSHWRRLLGDKRRGRADYGGNLPDKGYCDGGYMTERYGGTDSVPEARIWGETRNQLVE